MAYDSPQQTRTWHNMPAWLAIVKSFGVPAFRFDDLNKKKRRTSLLCYVRPAEESPVEPPCGRTNARASWG